jgi:predicted esterase
LAARLSYYTRVMQILETALSSGTWYGEAFLQNSPSLEPLQGNPDYERLLDISHQMQANDPANALPLLVVRPESECRSPDNPCPLLLFLHGNTDTAANNLEHWQSAAEDGWLLALPQSSGAMWAGAYAWTKHETAADEIETHLAKLTEQYVLDSSRIILAGFSMGAEIALWLALTGRVQSQGFILVGPSGLFMDDIEKWAPLIRDSQERGLHGAIITGLADTTIPHDNVRALVAALNSAAIPTDHEEHIDLAHEYPSNFPNRLRHALAFINDS